MLVVVRGLEHVIDQAGLEAHRDAPLDVAERVEEPIGGALIRAHRRQAACLGGGSDGLDPADEAEPVLARLAVDFRVAERAEQVRDRLHDDVGEARTVACQIEYQRALAVKGCARRATEPGAADAALRGRQRRAGRERQVLEVAARLVARSDPDHAQASGAQRHDRLRAVVRLVSDARTIVARRIGHVKHRAQRSLPEAHARLVTAAEPGATGAPRGDEVHATHAQALARRNLVECLITGLRDVAAAAERHVEPRDRSIDARHLRGHGREQLEGQVVRVTRRAGREILEARDRERDATAPGSQRRKDRPRERRLQRVDLAREALRRVDAQHEIEIRDRRAELDRNARLGAPREGDLHVHGRQHGRRPAWHEAVRQRTGVETRPASPVQARRHVRRVEAGASRGRERQRKRCDGIVRSKHPTMLPDPWREHHGAPAPLPSQGRVEGCGHPVVDTRARVRPSFSPGVACALRSRLRARRTRAPNPTRARGRNVQAPDRR